MKRGDAKSPGVQRGEGGHDHTEIPGEGAHELHKAEAPAFKGFIKGSERLNLRFGMMARVCVCV